MAYHLKRSGASVRFTWDATKSASNLEKHGVSFEEASELFESGEDYLELYDEAHSTFEERFLAIGPIRRGLVLVVWTERREDEVRIISARWASPREAGLFERFRGGG
jgi:uncharacterized DUF497 family protein